MSKEKPEGEWLKVRSLGPDDPMFELDSIKHLIVCNQNNKNFIRLADFLRKLTGNNFFPLRYMMLSLSVTYLIVRASQINPSTRIEIYNRIVKCIKGCIKTIAVVKPDAKERGKVTAKERRKKFGDTQSTMNNHTRDPPAMHFMCPVCDGPFKGEELVKAKKLYVKRQQWMRTVNTWVAIYKKKSTDGTNKLKDHFANVGLEIVGHNIDALYKELNSCGLRTTKTKKKRKFPKKGEKLKSKVAEDIKIGLDDEGVHVPDIPTDDPILKDQAENVLLYIRSFRTRRPDFEHDPEDPEQSQEDTWKEIARMYNTDKWEQIKDLVEMYCKANGMDIEATLGTKEYRESNVRHNHDEHGSEVSTEAKRAQDDNKDTDEGNNDDSNEESNHAPI